MKRIAFLTYGIVSYAIFFGTFLYTAGFLTNAVVPRSIDSGAAPESMIVATGVNLGLLLIFALQHSVMARIEFKAMWTKIVPKPIERATYVLFSSAAMILVFAAWQPMTDMVFQITGEAGRAIAYTMFAAGLGTVLYSTLLIDHFDLFGLRQVWLYFRGESYTEKNFVTPALYRHIRHPLYVGWFLTVWSTPDMTLGHLVFAAVASSYILVAVIFEERDLARLLGRPYTEWRARTPAFMPRFARRAHPVRTAKAAA